MVKWGRSERKRKKESQVLPLFATVQKILFFPFSLGPKKARGKQSKWIDMRAKKRPREYDVIVWTSFVGTIEGMAQGENLHVLQKKFIEHAALQCGICTPGLLVAAKSLLERNPDPTEEETRYWLAGNLCRCTGYDKIIRAVLDAAKEMREAA